MKPFQFLLVCSLILILISPAAMAITFCPTPTPSPSGGNCSMNWTCQQGPPGEQGIQGIQGIPGLDNMTSGQQGIQGIQGEPGTPGNPGSPGNAATIDVNSTFTGSPGTDALVTNIGSVSAALLDFTIPAGVPGATGATGPQGIPGEMNQTPNATPGTPGSPGSAATIDVNATFTGTVGTNADVVNIGDTANALLDFTIPKGDQGNSGTPGSPGSAATIDVNSTFTGSPGTDALVTNIGSVSAALLDFTIPAGVTGSQGSQGNPGNAATINVNLTFTGLPGSSASVVNIGSTSAALLDFTIPKGDQGDKGDAGTTDHYFLTNLTYAGSGHTGFEPTVTKGSLTASTPVALDQTRQVIGGAAVISLINDVAAAITEFDTGALANSDTVIPTSKAVTTALAAKAPDVTYAYITLMAGSAMVPTTSPALLDQFETTTNKNNYIFGTFTKAGEATENLQWIVDLPQDWNSADATNGKITATFLWTAASGSNNVKWTLSGKLLPNDDPIDVALAAIGSSEDTLLTAEDMHYSPDTTAAVVTSVGGGGTTAIFKVTRVAPAGTDMTTDAKLIGVRIKYIRTLA